MGEDDPGGRVILMDIGGVLAPDHLGAAAANWGGRLGMSARDFLTALFHGNDDQVLIGRMSETSWWTTVVRERLRVGEAVLAEIRRDLAARQIWDDILVSGLRRMRGRARTGLVSNAWPDMRTRLEEAGLSGIVDAIVLSCEVGFAKPDPRIYRLALARLDAAPAEALFIDDDPGHVDAARVLGMAGHVHIGAVGTLARIEAFLGSPPLPPAIYVV